MGHITRRKLIITTASAGALLATAGIPAIALADDKPTVAVGSKPFTESIVLGEMISLHLEDAGFPVERQLNLGGTAVAHEALVNGDIDVYAEYTGTALIAILGEELPEAAASDDATPAAVTGIDPVYDIVAGKYPEEFSVEWLTPFGLNNTYSIAVTQEMADEHGLKTMSGLADHAGDMTLGTDQEFPVRPDGLPGFEETYGYSFGDVKLGDIGLMYAALDRGEVDVITSYATDGRIQALGLVLLDDDKGFFPPYYAAPIVRQDLLEQAPDVADILNQLGGQISDDQMASMNYDVDEAGKEPIDVARDFLTEKGLIGG